MTLEEAIYGLKHAEIVFERTTGKMQFLKALKLVLDAAEKQIPMKPKIGKVIYVLYLAGWHKEIHREKVFMYGAEGFICESIVDASLDDNYRIREYKYKDYNKTWFTSLAEAKLSLKEMLEERNPSFIIKIVPLEDYWKACFERRAE